MKKPAPAGLAAPADEQAQPLADVIAGRMRQKIIDGVLTPGSHLSEVQLCEAMQVSRNTLREVFRLLTKEGLLRHEANRGVFVVTPDMSTIVDIYRIRRLIECPALASAHPLHPAVARMQAAIDAARAHREAGEWLSVGSADIAFHSAIVELADSPRLSAFYAQVSAELRLVFGLLHDPEYLHGPYVDQNQIILGLLTAGDAKGAAAKLEAYLLQAERFILGAYERLERKPANKRSR
ncbi:GntR family transcriptional regulator [Pannonibacter phragmitetus]|uniref:GntR family transcriptional regulator n=1 Tax=Pannonibacter phragmitetus TaxID=121719 RepID=A0A0U3PKR9_9HYPH|nr:GntR family transcriptional regulator [Pannonibacter phragmitetus]ALV27853.1 GntR family transcriptional regulator [Pannonibacter phragmitetus]